MEDPIPATTAPAMDTPAIILPPPEIRSIVDKTASFVAKSPKPEAFEDKMRARQATDSRFAFMNKEDAYHAYYQDRLASFRAGEVAEAKTDETNAVAAKAAEEAAHEDDGRPTQPPPLEFLVEQPPPMNAVDLDILRLTALFTARSGRRFTSELASRENRNYQFDFLRPSHSLFGYFNRLTEQYTKILMPSKEAQARLERRSGGTTGDSEDNALQGRREVLKDAQERVEWEKWETSRRQELEDAQEAERIAFAEIDWQDFVVVSTVEFTEGDEAGLVELPPPMSISEVENMTIAQKKMAAMIMEGREDEIAEDEKRRADAEHAEMELDDDDEAQPVTAETELEKERQRVTEIRAAESSGTRKIRKDYVPKSKRVVAPAPVLTTFGDQQVPVDEFAEHVRIELLDPRWKEAKRQSEANRSAANILPGGTDVSASIRALAAHRPDIFGTIGEDELRKEQEALALAQSKAREKVVWDGHTATKEAITARFAGESLDEQIEGIRRRKGLVELDEANRIGPAAPAPDIPAEIPAPPTNFMSGASFSAAPQPNQTNVPYSQSAYPQTVYSQSMIPPPPPPPMPYVAPDSVASTSQPIATLPARPMVAAPGETVPGEPEASGVAGRPAPEDTDDQPNAKRQRTEKKDDGTYFPEEEWIASHPDPITISVQLPVYAAKPEWGCEGQTIELKDLSLTLLVSTLRDRIHAHVDLPISKQKLSLNGRILQNTNTLAALNFEGGELIIVDIKGKK